jgi:CO/xanthine dehydrogenase FAD-binding subunit
MRTAVSALSVTTPRSLREALTRLREDPGLAPMAGCTDLYVGLQFGTEPRRRYLNLWGLESLRGVRLRNGVLVIGALTTFTDLIRSRLVQERTPMLAAAAREIGGVQIQNRGTIGGNIANASPAGDSLPPLAVADAVIVLQSVDAARRVPFTAFSTGYRRTVRRPDELIVAVEIPPIAGRQWFRKVGTRAAQAISKVVMAGVRDGRTARLAIGSVAPTVLRLTRTEAALAASGDLTAAQEALRREIAPIDDLRSTAAYRSRVASNLLARFWEGGP